MSQESRKNAWKMPSVTRSVPLMFANVAHFYSHLFMLIYPTVVIALETAFDRSYGELISLSFAGFVLYGVAALPAGWFGDRWSVPGMLTIFFLGTGLSAIAAGLASGPVGIQIALAAIGLFSAIYHPVGTAWIVANAKARGRALGINGVFGSAGIASASLVAGGLTAVMGWRAAFLVPGIVCTATGVAFLLVQSGMKNPGRDKKTAGAPPSPRALRGLALLAATALCVGFLAQAHTITLPKAFAVRAPVALEWAGLAGAGVLVSLALVTGAFGQLAGGWLADRFRLTLVYPGVFVVMVPLAVAAAEIAGLPFVALAALVMFAITASLPAENSLVAHYCPSRWHATAFGVKFVLALGVSSLAIPAAGRIFDATGDFRWMFLAMAMIAGTIVCFAMLLPGGRERTPQAAT